MLLREAAVNALAYLDANGRPCVNAYALGTDKLDTTCPICWPASTPTTARKFRAREGRPAVLRRVFFNPQDARPHMMMALREQSPGHGVIVADVDLGSVVDAIDRAQIGQAGYAYAVDSQRRADRASGYQPGARGTPASPPSPR